MMVSWGRAHVRIPGRPTIRAWTYLRPAIAPGCKEPLMAAPMPETGQGTAGHRDCPDATRLRVHQVVQRRSPQRQPREEDAGRVERQTGRRFQPPGADGLIEIEVAHDQPRELCEVA